MNHSNFIFYSDFNPARSSAVDHRLLDLLQGKEARIGYIPSESDLKRRYFKKIEESYEEIGLHNVLYFDLDQEFNEKNIPDLLACDAIHLSGGEIKPFLFNLKRRNFGVLLRKYVEKGGILIGVSAGAMLLTPSIGLCDFIDEGKLPSKEDKSLSLVDFEFYPHFDGDEKTIKKLCEYSKHTRKIIYACDDSSGVIVCGKNIELVGQVDRVENGKFFS